MTIVFSARVPATLVPNRLTQALGAVRADGHVVCDLTESNPTRVDLEYPADLLEALAQPAGLRYEPTPCGLPVAREAVAADYARLGVRVPVGDIVLTTSTSESYSTLFKLLCPPGSGVLAPAPSYPLLEHLARLDAIEFDVFRLEYHGRWSVDIDSIRRALTPVTRAIVIVQPNNPTGSSATADEMAAIGDICRAHDLALIVDEVFVDYPLDGDLAATPSVAPPDVLTFRLGGMSKSVGLPQVKLGWIALSGPEARLVEARARLELIGDTYLSVSTPVQLAAADLLQRGARIRTQLQRRVAHNIQTVDRLLARHPASQRLHTEAGWSCVLQVPATRSEESLVLELLERDHVLVHPGYFFDFPREAFVVLSLIVSPDRFADGVERLLCRAEAA